MQMQKNVFLSAVLILFCANLCTQLKVKTRLRELTPAARGSQDAGSHNLVLVF